MLEKNERKAMKSKNQHENWDCVQADLLEVLFGCLFQAADHILTTTLGGLYLSMPVRAFRNLDDGSVVFCDTGIDKGCAAFSAGSVYAHATHQTFVSSHLIPPACINITDLFKMGFAD
ncbi:MAG: hypothetical protein JXA13_06130 [Anaerolineales bacterium]|nr:hypothetical protein [Anaerolineales bacterium]